MRNFAAMNAKDFEIMAPVGSRESLAAAIQAGADSIYFGIERLNMRAHSASTFTIDDLKEIALTCHEHGMKSYLTVNTIIYGEDLPLMREIIDAAHEAGISAVIASDGVVSDSEDGWLRELLLRSDGDMKSLARSTLKEAEAQYGASDDMTVVTVRVEQRA